MRVIPEAFSTDRSIGRREWARLDIVMLTRAVQRGDRSNGSGSMGGRRGTV